MNRHTKETGHTVFEKLSEGEVKKLTYEFQFDALVETVKALLESFLEGNHALNRPSVAEAAEIAIRQFIINKKEN